MPSTTNLFVLSSTSLCVLLASAASQGSCDIYAAAGTPCVAAHSMTRALYGAYNGPLYQLLRASDNTTLDVGLLAEGGVANSAAQDRFCAGTECVVQSIYDQSPMQNHLGIGPAGARHGRDSPVNASRFSTTLNGHPVYAAMFIAGDGYRNDSTSGIATGNEPENLLMVTSGTVGTYNSKCCFDYGNAEIDNKDHGPGTMEAVYFGSSVYDGRKGAGSGPWVMADLENGLYPFNATGENPNNSPLPFEFVTAMVKGGSNGFALKGGDATQGPLQTMYDGPRPPAYQPMKKQGAIILGIGGDNSAGAMGIFFEGCITTGYPPDSADDDVQQNIVNAGYGK